MRDSSPESEAEHNAVMMPSTAGGLTDGDVSFAAVNEADSGGARSYMELPMWWIGMILMTLGETGNFLAYAYAPATLVAPLGAITVISNCILAHYVLKENINRRNVVGVVLAIVGAVFIVTYAPSSDEQLTMDLLEKYMAEKNFVAYLFCLVATITSLFASKEAHKKRYVVIYILICSMTGSITVMCVKGVSTALILTFEGHNQFIYFVPWMLLGMILPSTFLFARERDGIQPLRSPTFPPPPPSLRLRLRLPPAPSQHPLLLSHPFLPFLLIRLCAPSPPASHDEPTPQDLQFICAHWPFASSTSPELHCLLCVPVQSPPWERF